MTFHLNTTIKVGSHRLPSEGSCTMEIACLAAGFAWTQVRSENDLPECMSRVIGAYVIRLNDVMPDGERQKLMAFVPRLTMTRGTESEEQARAEYLVMNVAKPAVVFVLRSVGLHDHAEKVSAAQTIGELQAAAWAAEAAEAAEAAVWAARAAAWAAVWAGAFDWQPCLDALDGALRIGPQADAIDEAVIRDRVKVLERV